MSITKEQVAQWAKESNIESWHNTWDADDYRRLIRFATLAQSTVSEPWQPIATAPKNKHIMLWGKYWNDSDVFHHPMIGMWNPHSDRWEANFNGWFSVRPTHWTPLTTAPSETVKAKDYAWECNECGSQEYTMALSEADVQRLGCGKCGGDEWHKAEART